MGSSPGFGSTACDSIALLTLAFASAPHRRCLTLPHTVTRRLIMQKACGHPEGLPQFVSARFQVLFHSPPGVLFTFPSRYWFTIGHQLVFSLRRWASYIQSEFHVFRPTRDTTRSLQDFAYGAITRYGRTFQIVLLSIQVPHCGPHPTL